MADQWRFTASKNGFDINQQEQLIQVYTRNYSEAMLSNKVLVVLAFIGGFQ